jgi:thiol:disulfide interchange protein DsbD
MKQETNQEAWEVETLQTSIAKADQPVLLEFYASWCVSCHELEEALEAPGMNTLLSRYEVIRIDLSAMNQSHLDLLRHYGLYGPPALVIHENNHQKGPLVGLPDRKTLHAFLEKP